MNAVARWSGARPAPRRLERAAAPSGSSATPRHAGPGIARRARRAPGRGVVDEAADHAVRVLERGPIGRPRARVALLDGPAARAASRRRGTLRCSVGADERRDRSLIRPLRRGAAASQDAPPCPARAPGSSAENASIDGGMTTLPPGSRRAATYSCGRTRSASACRCRARGTPGVAGLLVQYVRGRCGNARLNRSAGPAASVPGRLRVVEYDDVPRPRSVPRARSALAAGAA